MARRMPAFIPALLVLVACAALVGCNDSDSVVFPTMPAPQPSDFQTYADAETCRTCHQAIYQSWDKTRHTMKVRRADGDTVVNDANSNGVNDFVEGGSGLAFDVGTSVPAGQTTFDDWNLAPGVEFPKLGFVNGVPRVRIGPNTYDVTFVLGGTGKWKQRYMVTIGEGEYISPVQYNDVTREYVPYHPENWYTISGDTLTGYLYGTGDTPVSEGRQRDSWQRRCMACHVTGVRDVSINAQGEYGAAIETMLANDEGPRFSELPVSCEACHGPAARHVELGGGIGTALNPADMAADRATEVCAGCHNRGASANAEGFGYPWAPGALVDNGFRPGDELDGFFEPVSRDGSRFWPGGARAAKSHRQQALEHAGTGHADAGVTCFGCHDPHGSTHPSDLRAPVNQLCLSCHDGQGNIDSSNLVLHTKHTSPDAQRCDGCHFVETAKSAIAYDVATHTYDVLWPQESELSPGMPNSCSGCHPGETTAQLDARVRSRYPDAKPVAYARAMPNPFGVGFDLMGDQSFDPLGSALRYEWTLVSGPPSFSQEELIAPSAAQALFVPAAPGEYRFLLTVTTVAGTPSDPAEVTVDVSEGIDQNKPDLRQSFYLGSVSCQICHADVHAEWEPTRHSQKVRKPDEGFGVVFMDTDENGEHDWLQNGLGGFDVANDPDGDHTAWDDVDFAPGITAPLLLWDAAAGRYFVEIGPITYRVTWVLGGTGKWKQRFMATIGEGEYILPVQYNEKTNEFVLYHPENWYVIDDVTGDYVGYRYDVGETPVSEGRTRDSWQRRCMGCHTTGARNMRRNSSGEYAASIQTMLAAGTGPRIVEAGIGCEACHGPGSQHLPPTLGGTGSPSIKGAIVNPSKLSAEASSETCGACHTRGTSVNSAGFGFPWGPTAVDGHFIPGEDVDEYYTPVDETGSRFWADPYGHSKSHHQQWLDMRWSKHFENAGMDCASCHTSHSDEIAGQLKAPGNTLCLSCHTGIEAEAAEPGGNHSRHRTGSPGNNCSTCHMPLTAKSAIEYDVSAHSWEIIWPSTSLALLEETGKAIPNSCMTGTCHATPIGDLMAWDENDVAANEEATEYVLRLFGDLPPYAQARVVNDDGASRRGGTFALDTIVTLDGSKSFEATGDPLLTPTWTILSAPAGSNARLSSRLVFKPTIRLQVAGTYVFSLVVKDSGGASEPDTVTVVVE